MHIYVGKVCFGVLGVLKRCPNAQLVRSLHKEHLAYFLVSGSCFLFLVCNP